MADQPSFPKYIFGLHEPGGEWLMEEEEKHGWIVFTHELGHDPNVHHGHDYTPWSDRGFGAIARLNHGYGAAGTIPLPQFYDQFATRVRNFVANSQGCHVWVIGNEMNHGQERPEGQIITPDRYASCYKKCRDQIHSLPGRNEERRFHSGLYEFEGKKLYVNRGLGRVGRTRMKIRPEITVFTIR